MTHSTERLPKPPRRHTRAIVVVAVACALLLLGAGVHMFWSRAQETKRADQAAQTAEELCRQIERMGRRCDVTPPPPGAEGKPGVGIRSTVTDGCYVTVHRTDNTSDRLGPFCGRRGDDGIGIANATVKDCMLVVTLTTKAKISTGPICGPPGKDGIDGSPGAQGEKGPAGPAGRSIIDTDCIGSGEDSYWLFTYREPDGSTTQDTVDGPCRVQQPGPPESPSPSPALLGGK
jgi:hypothetical protein